MGTSLEKCFCSTDLQAKHLWHQKTVKLIRPDYSSLESLPLRLPRIRCF